MSELHIIQLDDKTTSTLKVTEKSTEVLVECSVKPKLLVEHLDNFHVWGWSAIKRYDYDPRPVHFIFDDGKLDFMVFGDDQNSLAVFKNFKGFK